MTKKLLTLSALLAALYAQAQDSTAKKALDEVVVTATKYPKKTSETGKVITIITREQLDRSGGKDLSQLLNEQAGVSVNGANSNPGKDKSIYLRGAKAEYTLIMIDGAPIYDATGSSSNFDFRLMPVDHIERIEILKGSQSTLYGSDAVAGVINIITRKGSNKPFSPFATATYGSYETRKINAGVSGSTDIINYNVGYTHYKTDGISEATDKNNTGQFDKDGYEQNALMANLGFHIHNIAKINYYLRYSKYNGNLDADYFSDDKDYSYNLKNLQAGMRNEFTLGNVKLNLLYNYTVTERNFLNDSLVKESPLDGYSKGFYEGKEHFIDAYVHVPVVHGLSFTGGVDYRNGLTDVRTSGIYKYDFGGVVYSGQYASTISADSAEQEQVGVYGALTYASKAGFNIEAGGRFNHHAVYGNNGVFNINPSFLINRQFKVFANISTAYKVPTLYQLYSEYRNPFTSLNPEKAITYEGGIQYFSTGNLVNARVAVFKRNVKDGIAFYTDPGTFDSYYINQDKQKDWGFEIEPTINFRDKAQIILSYAYVDGKITTKNGAKDTSYFNLLRRPKSIFGATVNYHVTQKLFVSAGVQSFGKRSDLDFSTSPSSIIKLDAYTLVNAYAEYKLFNNKLRLFVDAKNLTDTDYSEVYGYNTLGFNIQGGFRINL